MTVFISRGLPAITFTSSSIWTSLDQVDHGMTVTAYDSEEIRLVLEKVYRGESAGHSHTSSRFEARMLAGEIVRLEKLEPQTPRRGPEDPFRALGTPTVVLLRKSDIPDFLRHLSAFVGSPHGMPGKR